LHLGRPHRVPKASKDIDCMQREMQTTRTNFEANRSIQFDDSVNFESSNDSESQSMEEFGNFHPTIKMMQMEQELVNISDPYSNVVSGIGLDDGTLIDFIQTCPKFWTFIDKFEEKTRM